MFSAGFSHKEIAQLLKRKKATDWLVGISNESDINLINNNWCCLKRELVRSKTNETKTYFYINLNNCFEFTDYDYCKLAHEITHLCQFFLPDVLDRTKEIEAEAYFHTHIMQQCLKILRG